MVHALDRHPPLCLLPRQRSSCGSSSRPAGATSIRTCRRGRGHLPLAPSPRASISTPASATATRYREVAARSDEGNAILKPPARQSAPWSRCARARSSRAAGWRLLWAAGIIWFAYDVAGSQPQDGNTSANAEQATDATGAPVTLTTAAARGGAQQLLGRLPLDPLDVPAPLRFGRARHVVDPAQDDVSPCDGLPPFRFP